MKTSTALAFLGTCLVLGAVLFMTAADDAAQRKAEAQMKARIFTKFPDPALAELAVPLAGGN
ncbi:hypothetical protein [Herbaspirillum chlorophenolicum]|uniref:hypothetical protein n=1 Tax=Herbaspirillum chlorophenolicum TaxID=211589 RepID=UPI00067AF257|nr:hypothetical protein [Herbaspirillum chlorophenolicum]